MFVNMLNFSLNQMIFAISNEVDLICIPWVMFSIQCLKGYSLSFDSVNQIPMVKGMHKPNIGYSYAGPESQCFA